MMKELLYLRIEAPIHIVILSCSLSNYEVVTVCFLPFYFILYIINVLMTLH